ncbi:MAG: TetR/AcrR family transcriptional regulator [Actinobacteria bacterium]|nr:TetR/AcrR family transcriptional regulator [Actinomycetota bacterium]
MADEVHSSPGLRADARNNRARILAAALDVFVELGPSAPLEEISRRAGTGIATLYRRFPTRSALMTAVVLGALTRTIDEARAARESESSAFEALRRYMHRALEIRAAAVIPALLGQVPLDDPEMRQVRTRGAAAVQSLVDAAHAEGSLRTEVTSGDIGMLIVRLARPLPGAFDRDLDNALAHRHLDLLIEGLVIDAHVIDRDHAAAGPALTLADLDRRRRRSR